MNFSDICKAIDKAIVNFQNAKPLTLRDHVLVVYDQLKQQIDSGYLIDAWVTDAYIDKETGEPQIFVKCIKPAAIQVINVSCILQARSDFFVPSNRTIH